MEPDFAKVQCSVDRTTQVIVNVIVAFAVLYFLVTCTLLVSRLRSYRKLPYTYMQVGLVYNTLQVGRPLCSCRCCLGRLHLYMYPGLGPI